MLTLSGEVIRLEPLSLDHVDELLAAATLERSTYGFTWVPDTRASMVAYVEAALAERGAGTSVPFATVAVAGSEVLGSTRFLNLRRWEWPLATGSPDVAEVGATWLSSTAQRTGVNAEAKLLQLTHAFEVWRVQRLELKTDARNERSRQAIERLGATLDGVLRAYQPAADGPWPRDTAMYSILPEQWPAVKACLLIRLDRPA
jgi:RimJ/RimL family protein N-acetyltransferase